jgi:hypothetical protein
MFLLYINWHLQKNFIAARKKVPLLLKEETKYNIDIEEKSTERHLIMRGSNIHRSHPSKWLFNYKQYVLVDTEKT